MSEVMSTDEQLSKLLGKVSSPKQEDYSSLYLSGDELDSLPQPKPIIDEVLYEHSLAILSGRDESFKSFIALDWALCIATGSSWQGRQVKQGKALYVAGEGAYGLSARKKAWEAARDTQVDPHYFTVRIKAPNLYDNYGDIDELLERVEAEGYKLVVFDTLRRISGRAKSNSDEIAAVIDHLEDIKRVTGDGSVLTIAHTDKGDNDTRGFSGIEDDVDIVWHSTRKDLSESFTLENTKMKDGPETVKLDLTMVESGHSIVIEEGSQSSVTSDLAPNQERILEVIYEMNDPTGNTVTEIAEATGKAKGTMSRAIGELRRKGLVMNHQGTRRVKLTAEARTRLDATHGNAQGATQVELPGPFTL